MMIKGSSNPFGTFAPPVLQMMIIIRRCRSLPPRLRGETVEMRMAQMSNSLSHRTAKQNVMAGTANNSNNNKSTERHTKIRIKIINWG